ncbi:MAG: hypothetical protein QG671_1561 [Actinomycetota bacterium]|nr:hypothetical protein [Actinomycetota bacterium]
MDRQPASVLTNTLQLMAGPDATPRGKVRLPRSTR